MTAPDILPRLAAFRGFEDRLLCAQRLATAGALTGGIAHEYNNLLMAIRGNLALLLYESGLDERIRTRLQQADQAADRAVQLTQQLHALGRAPAENATPLDLNTAVKTFSESARLILGRRTSLLLQLANQPLPVSVEPVALQQILLNLCLNAKEASAAGTPITLVTDEITLSPEQAATVGKDSGARFARCQVIDAGTGIAPDTRAEIFQPFFSTKPKCHHAGLGLSAARWLAERAGGWIDLKSAADKGTTVAVCLPRISTPETTVR